MRKNGFYVSSSSPYGLIFITTASPIITRKQPWLAMYTHQFNMAIWLWVALRRWWHHREWEFIEIFIELDLRTRKVLLKTLIRNLRILRSYDHLHNFRERRAFSKQKPSLLFETQLKSYKSFWNLKWISKVYSNFNQIRN